MVTNTRTLLRPLSLNTAVAGAMLCAIGWMPLQAAAGFQPPAGWSKAGDFSGVTMWSLTERNQTLTVFEEKGLKGELPSANDIAYIEDLKESNWMTNTLGGIKHWTVQSIKREKTSSGTIIKIRGTYTDSADQSIAFEEWKYYFNEGFAQITHAEVTAEAGHSSTADVQTLLTRFQPFAKGSGG